MGFVDNAKKVVTARANSKLADAKRTAITRATQYADKLSHGLVGNILAYANRPASTDIVFHSELTDEYIILPVIPNPLPTINEPQNNETFVGMRGDIVLIGALGLRTLTLDNILLPVGKDYSFMRSNGTDGEEVLNFFRTQRQIKAVIRICIIQTDGTEILNMPCVIDSLTSTKDKVGDYKVTVGIKEYVYTNTSVTNQSATGGELSEENKTSSKA